jgi:UDP-N-acetyl-D-glucosamine dehydrogenase
LVALESTSLKILELLIAQGAAVDYNDPYVARIPRLRHYNFEGMDSVPIVPETPASCDCVLIATDRSSYDYAEIAGSAPLVVDTRNAAQHIPRNGCKIVLV